MAGPFSRRLLAGLLAAVGAVLAGSSIPAFDPHVFVVTSDHQDGGAAAMTIEAPWTVAPNLEPVGANPLVRHFFGRHYVVNRDVGTIQVIDPTSFETLTTLDVGGLPQDILVVGARQAYVSRFDSAELLQIDPVSGLVTDVIDLTFLADPDGIPEMGTMILDGFHLFLQLQRLDQSDPQWAAVPPSFMAVIDVRTNQLVDADPETDGVQAIRLAGRRPAYKMTLESQNRRLYVSVPAGFFDTFEGAVEQIDLDTLRSLRFITTEGLLQTLDLSAFTLVSPDKGFVVTHTEIVESSHVTGFSRHTGTPVSQIYTTLFGSIRNIVHDPPTSQVFLPDHTDDGTVGVLVFDAVTDEILTPTPVDVGAPPVDLVVTRPVSPGEAVDLQVDSIDHSTGRLSLSYLPACEAADHNLVYGPLDQVSAYAYTGQDCGIGNLGSYDGFDPGPGSVFYLVVGSDGVSVEGSYGAASGPVERPEMLGDPVCTFTQELSLRCD
jgi:hypothetical protein